MARSTLLLITHRGNVFLCAENHLSGGKLTPYYVISACMSLLATGHCPKPCFPVFAVVFFPLTLWFVVSLQKIKIWNVDIILFFLSLPTKIPFLNTKLTF